MRLFASIALLLVAGTAIAQGGPPMVTDDPETPGDGKWEINLAAFGDHTRTRLEGGFPDADINYGLGDRIQLKVDVPWGFAKDKGESWKSGLGTGNVGVKWRFVDGGGEGGPALSTYPQYLSGWSASARRNGVASSDHEFFLPLEIARKVGEWSLDGEAGRAFMRDAADQWVVGGIAAHECGGKGECLFEIHETIVPHDRQTLLNLGLRWKLSESSTFLASAGREFGPRTDDRQDFVFYLGVQLLR